MRTLVFLIPWLAGLAMAFAQDLDFTHLPANRTLTVTGHPDYAPIVWRSTKTKQLEGVSVEMLIEALKGTGIQVKTIAVDTWGRAQREVEEGRIDVLLPPYKNRQRIKSLSFQLEPMLTDKSVLFVKKGHKFRFHELSDLKGKRGVAIISDSFGDEFDRFDREVLKMNRLPTTARCFTYILRGRGDFVVAGSSAGKAVLAKAKQQSQFEILDKPVVVTGMYAAISKKSAWDRPEFHAYLVQQFEKMQSQGLVPKLEEKYIARFGEE